MKKFTASFLVVLLALFTVGCDQKEEKKDAPALAEQASEATEVEQPTAFETGYAVGVSLGKRLQMLGLEVDSDDVLEGLNDVLEGEEVQLSDAQLQKVDLRVRQAQVQAQRAAIQARISANKEISEVFLTEFMKHEEAKKTESGLYYEVLQVTEDKKAKSPSADATVKIHFIGRRLDGSIFDTTKKGAGEPVSMKVTQLLGGLQEGIQMMKPGEVYSFVLTPELGYGMGSKDGKVTPFETTIVELQLVEIVAE